MSPISSALPLKFQAQLVSRQCQMKRRCDKKITSVLQGDSIYIMTLDLIKYQIPPPKKSPVEALNLTVTHTSLHLRFIHRSSSLFTFAEITAIPPQEHSMQVVPGSLFRRVAGAHAA